MSPSPVKVLRRLSWLSAVAAIVAAPKCLLCLAAYAGVGALFGFKLAGPEICGASASPLSNPIVWLAAAASLAVTATAFRTIHRRRRLGPPSLH